MTTSSGPGTPEQALLTARIAAGALLMGVVLFAGVAWFITAGGQQPIGAVGLGDVLVYAWIAVAFATAMGAMVVWRRKVGPLLESAGLPDDALQRAADLSTSLVIVWALLDGQAFLGLVVFFLSGTMLPFYGALIVMAVGMAVTFPRSGWFVP